MRLGKSFLLVRFNNCISRSVILISPVQTLNTILLWELVLQMPQHTGLFEFETRSLGLQRCAALRKSRLTA